MSDNNNNKKFFTPAQRYLERAVAHGHTNSARWEEAQERQRANSKRHAAQLKKEKESKTYASKQSRADGDE